MRNNTPVDATFNECQSVMAELYSAIKDAYKYRNYFVDNKRERSNDSEV